jgi:hypothetical protein
VEYSNLQQLVVCPKVIKGKKKQSPIIQKGSEHYTFNVNAVDNGTWQFRVFLRKNLKFTENFSVGLEFLAPVGDTICLVRFNGDHEHRNQVKDKASFRGFHIHEATEEALSQGIKAENFASLTTAYTTFEGAVPIFWKHVNIQTPLLDVLPQWETVPQLRLFE